MARPVVYEIVGGTYKNSRDEDEVLSAFLVDPNPADGDTHLQEDLFVYLELTARPKSRSIIQSQGNGQFISTGTDYTAPVSFITTTVQNGKEYHTTNYMEIDGIRSEVEGFGIKRVQIEVGADFTPKITIEFFDVKGGSFRELDDYGGSIFAENPLSMFFRLPYPVFELTAKGFYGRAVKYCLNLMKWNAGFDPDSGGFNIKAEFIGYTFAFLADIPLKHIWAISQTPQGREKLKQNNILPFSEMMSKFGQLTRLSEDFKINDAAFLKLKNLNLAISKLAAIIKKTGAKSNEGNQSIFTSYIEDANIGKNTDQVFVRDIGILNVARYNDYVGYATEVSAAISEYNAVIEGLGENFYANVGVPPLVAYYGAEEILPKIREKIGANEAFDASTVTAESISQRFVLDPASNNFYYLLDFFALRQKLADLLGKIRDRKKEQEIGAKAALNDIYIDKIGFSPTVENIFSIICGNTDAYLSVLYDYSMRASSELLSRDRVSSMANFVTDIEGGTDFSATIHPFPDVVDGNDEKIWIGSAPSVNKSAFPEIEAVDLIINGLNQLYTQESQQQYRDSLASRIQREEDVHFPASPLDYGGIAYDELNFISDGALADNAAFVGGILDRLYSLLYCGGASAQNRNHYARIEANNFYNNVPNSTVLMAVDNMQSFGPSVFASAVENGLLEENSAGYYEKPAITINGIDLARRDITIKSQNEALYLEVVGNTVVATERIGELFDKLDVDPNYNAFFNENYILAKDYSYQFFAAPIPDRVIDNINRNPTLSQKIYTGNAVKNDLYDFIVLGAVSDLWFIEGKARDTGNPVLDTGRERLRHNNESNIYRKYYKVLLGVGYSEMDEIFRIISQYTGLLYTSKHYLAYLGGCFYFENDPIAEGAEFSVNISAAVRQKLIAYFKGAAETSGERLNDAIETYRGLGYVTTESDPRYPVLESAYNTIRDEITATETIIVENGKNVYAAPDPFSALPQSVVTQYLGVFHQELKSLLVDMPTDAGETQVGTVDPVMGDADFKLDVYESLKAVYDKWLAYGLNEGKIYNACFAGGVGAQANSREKSLIDYFHFIDRTWNDIGDRAVINPKILMNLTSNSNETLYGFITKILNDSKFLVYFAPSFTANRTVADLEVMFTPQPTVSNAAGGANMIAIYTGGNSKNLKIPKSQFKNDGFNFLSQSVFPKKFGERKAPKRLTDNPEEKAKYNISCFLVEYGKDNQQHFQSVNVSSEEHYNTSEYLEAYSDLVDRGSSLKRFYKGIDIYNLYQIRSYKASVSGLGNMQVQPMNYFQLNIPLFQGVYLITKATHTIEANYCNTSFEGYRMPSYTYPIVTDVTSYIKLPDNIFDLVADELESGFAAVVEEDSVGSDATGEIAQQTLQDAAASQNSLFTITVVK